MAYKSVDQQMSFTLSADDISELLGISRSNAYVLMHSKGFPTLRIGKRVMVPRDEFFAWIKDQLPER